MSLTMLVIPSIARALWRVGSFVPGRRGGGGLDSGGQVLAAADDHRGRCRDNGAQG
jgi:hypothetical protein